MSRARAAVLVLGCLSATVHTKVQAERPGNESNARTSACPAGAVYGNEMREGVAAHDSARYVEARAHFECAHELDASARTWLALGLASYALHDFERAYEEFQKALTDTRNELSPTERQGMAPTIKEIEKELGEVRVNVSPPDAQLFVDGVAKDIRTLRLKPGTRELRAVARGYGSREIGVDVRAGSAQSVDLDLGSAGPDRTLALIVGGVGVAGIGVGAVFGILSMNKHSESDRLCPKDGCLPAGSKAMDDAIVFGNVSTVAFIVGGVGIAGAAVLWFTAGSSEEPGVESATSQRGRTGSTSARRGGSGSAPAWRGSSSSAPRIGLGPGTLQLRASF